MPKTTDDLGLVLKAAQFAAHKHKDQRRKDARATPYINHPIGLAEVLHTDGSVRDPIVIAAALLHDTIEDTETTYDELRGVLASPPARWSLARRQDYFDWAKDVVDQVRGVSPKLERMFDQLYRQRPSS